MHSIFSHAWANRLQTLLLVLTLFAILLLAGVALLGEDGFWVALAAGVFALAVEPAAASQLTLRLYRARPITEDLAPEIWGLLRRIAAGARLPAIPRLYYVPSPIINAFAVGNRRESAIALTDGLLRSLSLREIAGVLAHETAHIAFGDLRVMGLADYVTRLTSVFGLLGQILLLLALPWLLIGDVTINWLGVLLLIASPYIAWVVQRGLSRVREFDADLKAVTLTGDPLGLASALARIEGRQRSWRGLLLPGWGHPEPSWLRTHPATEERIRRLMALHRQSAAASTSRPTGQALSFSSWPGGQPMAPRWHLGGFWR